MVALWLGLCAGSACTSSTFDEGGSSNYPDGGSYVYVPPKCNQGCQDYMVGSALEQTVLLLYNENIPGLPGGGVDVNASCPLEGTVHVTGTVNTTTDGTSTVHLDFDMTGCKNSSSLFVLTFEGSVSLDGTFNNGDSGAQKFTAFTYMSSEVTFSGSLSFLDDPEIDFASSIAETQQQSGGGDSTLDGQVGDRTFSSETSLDFLNGGGGTGGGTAGSDASDAGPAADSGSTGATDCTCYCGWPTDMVCGSSADCPPDESVPGTSVPGVCGCPSGC